MLPLDRRRQCAALPQDQRNAEIIDLLEPALGLWRSRTHSVRCASRFCRGIQRLAERRLVAEEPG
jgi:hypothetical protein